MEKHKGVTRCKGCEACVVTCKQNCIKVEVDEDKVKHPVANTNGCQSCNNCKMYCPMTFPVTMPEFTEFFDSDEDLYARDMAPIYRQVMRSVRDGERTEFYGYLCQIGALISLFGDRVPPKLILCPVKCDMSNPPRKTCEGCEYYQ